MKPVVQIWRYIVTVRYQSKLEFKTMLIISIYVYSPTPIKLSVVKYFNDEPFISIPSSIMIGYKDLEELETRRGTVLIEIFSARTKYTQNQSLYQSSHPIYFCYFVFYNIIIKHLQVETKIATRWPKTTLI